MLFKAPEHKKNTFSITITGNFTDSIDSFYRFKESEIMHITFVKKSDGSIFEEVRSLIFLEGIDQFFPSDEVELIYRSNYKSVRGYRIFLRKQTLFEEHETILKKYAYDMQKMDYSIDYWDESPF